MSEDKGAFARVLESRWLGFAFVVAGVFQLWLGEFNCNIAWFTEFADRVMSGAQAYRDISDPNPPGAFVLYMPAVFASRLSGLSADVFIVVEALIALGAALLLANAILAHAELASNAQRALMRNLCLFIFALAPAYCYGEREHFAAIFVLPFFAALAARMEARRVNLSVALLAGFLAGAALAFKPHFGLALAAACLVALWRQRSLALLFTPEVLTAVATAGLNFISVALLFPDFYKIALPDAMTLYAPARNGVVDLVSSMGFLASALILALVAESFRRFGINWRAALAAAAAFGFLIVYIVQAKLWIYQAYPAIAFGCLALAVIFAELPDEQCAAQISFAKMRLGPALALAPIALGLSTNLSGAETYPGLRAAVEAAAPRGSTLGALQEQVNVAFPVARQSGSHWVGRQNALWRANCADYLSLSVSAPERLAMLKTAREADIADFVEDIRRGKPRLLIVENEEVRLRYLRNAAVADVLAGYEKLGVYGGVELWRIRGGA